MKLSHEVLLALAYVSQISDPDSVKSRFIESLNGLDEKFTFVFTDRLPDDVRKHRILPIATIRSSFGYALMEESSEIADDERAVFRNAFQFLATLLENRIQARALESRNESLLEEINIEKSLLRTVLDTLPVGVWVANEKGKMLLGNAANYEIWGGGGCFDIDQYSKYNAWRSDAGEPVEPADWGIARSIRTGETVINQEIGIESFDGKHKTILHSAAPLLNENRKIIGAVGVNQNISEHKQAEKALESERSFLSAVLDNIEDAIVICDGQGRLVRFNESARRLHGLPEQPIPADQWAEYYSLFREDGVTPLSMEQIPLLRALHGERVQNAEIVTVPKQSCPHYLVCSGQALTGEKGEVIGAVIAMHDITERKKNEMEQGKLQRQLIQAQKMEAVGRLAGGVAHDYNNMLSIITGYAELVMDKLDQDDPVYADIMEIYDAAGRSTDITRQLLAFARQQTTAPKVLDLNETLGNMLKMLRRLIGEDIDLAWRPGSEVWRIKIDPSQIDQILVNLCVNARDAIKGVGKITIETRNIQFDDAYCADHVGFNPGDYVMLAVSDDGEGMTPETLDNIFEPFFTTKNLHQGTGLGLATVYGIARQNNGFVNVYSEPEKGTTFRIYLPRQAEKTTESRHEITDEIPLSRGETILLVEDDPSILKMGKTMLERLGYVVTPAASPGEAVRLAMNPDNEIALLITDVVMPDMNGRQLSEKLKDCRPDLKTLFMSGYTANVIAHRGVLDDDVFFIQKPFSKTELALKVREALDNKTIRL